MITDPFKDLIPPSFSCSQICAHPWLYPSLHTPPLKPDQPLMFLRSLVSPFPDLRFRRGSWRRIDRDMVLALRIMEFHPLFLPIQRATNKPDQHASDEFLVWPNTLFDKISLTYSPGLSTT